MPEGESVFRKWSVSPKLDPRGGRRWRLLAELQQHLGERFQPLTRAVQKVAESVVRASSVIENLLTVTLFGGLRRYPLPCAMPSPVPWRWHRGNLPEKPVNNA